MFLIISSLKLAIMGFMITHTCVGIAGGDSEGFLLKGCATDNIDMLCLYFDGVKYHTTHEDQRFLCRQFIEDLTNFPSNKTTPRVMFAEIVDRFSALDPNVNVSSWHLNSNFVHDPYGLLEHKVKIRLYKSNENTERKLEFIGRLFSEMDGVRGSADQIAVVFFDGTGLSYEGSRNVSLIAQHGATDIKIFVVVMGVEFASDKQLFNNTLLLSRKNTLLPNHALTLSICGQCMEGWWPVSYNGRSDSLSCYKLLDAGNKIDHEKAYQECTDTYGGLLASIESVDELNFLRSRMVSYFISQGYENNSTHDDSRNFSADIYIGLYRDTKTVTSRHKWGRKEPSLNRPLTVRNWSPGKPSGGHNMDCGVWRFKWGDPVIVDIDQDNVDIDQANVDTNQANVDTNQSNVDTNQSNVETNQSNVDTNQSNVDTNQSNVDTNQSNVDTNQSNVDTNQSNVDTNQSSVESKFSDGWVDVKCRETFTSLSLCEVDYPRRIENKNLMKINAATKERFNNALTKGHYIEFESNIVSISAHIVNTQFVEFLKQAKVELFPLFDCGQDSRSHRYIAYVYVCDKIEHCSNRRDEASCVFEISDTYWDIIYEHEWKKCTGITCCDGSCLPLQFVNDGEVDCSVCDYSTGNEMNDETGVLNTFVKENQTCAFVCDRSLCVTFSQLNDGEVACGGAEGPLDETIGKLETADTCTNILGEIIWAPRCVYVRDLYGAVIGCRDMSHVQACNNYRCVEGYFKCPNTYCIPQHYVLDGTVDCPIGEDEQLGNIEACSGNFACWDSKMCLHPDLVCDEHPDCPHGDDEADCIVECAEGFSCVSTTVTLSHYNRSIPLHDLDFIDIETKYLDLSGLDLSVVGKDLVFYLVAARFIKWSNCQITNLNEMLGYSSHLIQELDVSHNLIQKFDGSDNELFNLQNIRLLNLSFNRKLIDVIYLQYTFLETLDLSHTRLSRVDESVLVWLPGLQHLDLSFTVIQKISSTMFPSGLVLRTLDVTGLEIDNVHENIFNNLAVSEHLYTDTFELCCPQIRGRNIMDSTCHANSGSISSCFDLIGLDVQRVLLWVMAVLAVLLNMTVVLFRLIWDRPTLRTGFGLFVTNLGISDFVMGVYLLIIAGADCYYRGVYVLHDKSWRESDLCRIAGFLATVSSESSRCFIFLITLDRFLVMKFPFGEIKLSNFTKTVCVLMSWMIGVCLALVPVLFRVEVYSSNAMCLGLPLTAKRFKGWEFSFSVFIVLNFLLSLVIAYGQRAIYRAMSENRFNGSESRTCSRRVTDLTVIRQLSLIALSNFLCWFPVGVLGLFSLCHYQISNEVYSWTTVIILPVSSAANPLLYTIPALLVKWEMFKLGNRK